jgi:hypothetical protein
MSMNGDAKTQLSVAGLDMLVREHVLSAIRQNKVFGSSAA